MKAQKYLKLMLKQDRQLKNAKKYERGHYYNSERCLNWGRKANQTSEQMQILENQMTDTEKQKFDDLLGCEYFF